MEQRSIKIKQLVISVILLLVIFVSGCATVSIYPDGPSTIITEDGVHYSLYHYNNALDQSYDYGYDLADSALNTAFLLIVENRSEQVIALENIADAALLDFFGRQHQLAQDINFSGRTINRLTAGAEKTEVNKSWDEKFKRVSTADESLASQIQDIKKEINKSRQEELAYRRAFLIKEYKQDLMDKVLFRAAKIFPSGQKAGLLVFKAIQPDRLARFQINILSHLNKPLAFEFELVIEN